MIARHQLCALKLVEDDYEGAMELLLEIMRVDDQYANAVGRNDLLSLFKLPGVDQALVTRYRKKMHEFSH